MSLNSLSSSNLSFYHSLTVCFKYRSSFLILTTFSITNILLLFPLYILVLYLGARRWLRHRSTAASHSDVFTYHMVAMEVIAIFGCGLFCCGACLDAPRLMMAAVYFFSVSTNGQILFHILTCVERHLAVIHPIAYLALRKRGGVRIRNVTIGCIWLFFLGSFGIVILKNNTITFVCLSILAIAVVSFCSLSVLHALIRPGPGEGGRERLNQSKMRAFHIIAAIMGALLIRFGGCLLSISIHTSLEASESVRCVLLVSGAWFCLPSSLVLPLLFLHRAGKLTGTAQNQDMDQSRAP